ncbi:MAG: phosphate acyltransferase PlsX [Candidatus Omnitrophota bacterium]
MKIIVDAMGGDLAPGEIIDGAVQAVKDFSDIEVALVGLEDQIEQHLSRYEFPRERVEVIHAPEVIEMNDPATATLRRKRYSSISLGLGLLKDSQYNAFISAGNTGAVVAGASVFLGMLEGVERPAIGTVLPTLKGFSLLLDVGANTDPKPQHLVQSALMAKVYVHDVLGIEKPTVGLLNVGEEETKGTDFVKEIHRMLSEKIPENFIGNVEGSGIFRGDCDCIVCDGFVGNVVLKVSESLAESAIALIKREVKKSPMAMLGAFLMRPRLRAVRRHADYSEYGGAPLLGVNGIVIICHGRSNAKAIKNAIRAACREAEHNILDRMKREIVK